MHHLIRVLCVLLVLSLSLSSRWAWAESDDELVVTTITDAAKRSAMVQAVEGILSDITPQQGTDTTEGASQVKDDQYVLWGELFEKGRTQAVVELSRDSNLPTHIALADWDAKKGAWKVRQVIRVPMYWMSPEILESKTAFKPDNLPAKAFWVKQLSPTAPRLLVVSTPHSPYRTGHFVFTYNVTAHQLDAGADFSVAEPTLREGYVVLTNDSGRKAHSGQDSFYQVESGRLKFRGSLRTGSYHGDDIHIHVEFMKSGSPDMVTWRFNASAEDQSTFKIQAGEEEDSSAPVLGHIHFVSGNSEAHGAYLLHKFTSLPVTVVDPRLFGGESSISMLKDDAVKVTGNEEVLRLLGPAKTSIKPDKGK